MENYEEFEDDGYIDDIDQAMNEEFDEDWKMVKLYGKTNCLLIKT